MGIFVGAIADDDTGATDLAGMLTEQGMRAIVVTEEFSGDKLQQWSHDVDAVIVGTASRSIEKAEAYRRTRAAAEALVQLSPRVLAIKYCSTFDSTPEGNIGASIDAALDATGERFTVALPALPVLGRTTYMGYHFVGEQLLSDSGMRDHPLNPMHNPHLPSHLATQTDRKVGLANHAQTALSERLSARLAELRAAGFGIAVLDCVDQTNLQQIGEAIAGLPLITGSSSWGMVLPDLWRKRGWLALPTNGRGILRKAGGSGFLVASGSCSRATQAQNAWASANGFTVLEIKASRTQHTASDTEALVRSAAAILRSGGRCLLSTTAVSTRSGSAVTAAPQGSTTLESGQRIANQLAEVVKRIFSECVPQGLIIPGGETSSTLMRALHLGGLRVGQPIEPGVPLCVALNRPELALVLKSGNFGSEEFYARSIAAIQALPTKDGGL